jgi:hypothetical protein
MHNLFGILFFMMKVVFFSSNDRLFLYSNPDGIYLALQSHISAVQDITIVLFAQLSFQSTFESSLYLVEPSFHHTETKVIIFKCFKLYFS